MSGRRYKPFEHKFRVSQWRDVLANNWKEVVYKGKTYNYTSPSPDSHRVPSWLWDSCYHTQMWARVDPEYAKSEMRTLLSFVYPNGQPPMILYLIKQGAIKRALEWIFFKRFLKMNGPGIVMTQPPLHAETVLEIYRQTNDVGFLREVAPMLKKIYCYFRDERDPNHDFLISNVHPLETGTDSGPEFDEALYGSYGAIPFARFLINYLLYRKHSKNNWSMPEVLNEFNFVSPMFNALYVLNLEALTQILKIIKDSDGDMFDALAKNVTNALIEKCYDPERGVFACLYGSSEKKTKVKTLNSVIPIALNLPPSIIERLVEHLVNPNEFNTEFPVPSVARDEATFYPRPSRYLWRGTSWMNTNWYIVQGLVRHGEMDLARNIAKKSFEMVKLSGYREYYNPITGEGYGDTEHGWSTMLIAMLEITDQLYLLSS